MKKLVPKLLSNKKPIGSSIDNLKVVENNYTILGKYSQLMQPIKQKSNTQPKTIRIQKVTSTQPSLDFSSQSYLNRRTQIIDSVQSAIDLVLSEAKLPNIINSMFWKVNSIQPNPNLTSVFVTWSTLPNSIHEKERVEDAFLNNRQKLENLLLLKLKSRHLKVKFAKVAQDESKVLSLLDRIEVDVHNRKEC